MGFKLSFEYFYCWGCGYVGRQATALVFCLLAESAPNSFKCSGSCLAVQLWSGKGLVLRCGYEGIKRSDITTHIVESYPGKYIKGSSEGTKNGGV